MIALIMSALTLLVGAFGGYLTGYAKKKGENLATHEDIGKLTEQVAAVTKTAKEIEATISSDLWDRQKRWELKREVLFEATKRVAAADAALASLDSFLQVEMTYQNKEDPNLVDQFTKHSLRFIDAATALDETRLLVDAVCGAEAKAAIEAFSLLTKALGAGISRKDHEIYTKSLADLAKKRLAVGAAIRKELKIEDVRPRQPPVV
jgi:hypothetical protein